ncbi:MAG TPA: hypothetical protein VF480_08590 [Verrucomicrobiae bacterium]
MPDASNDFWLAAAFLRWTKKTTFLPLSQFAEGLRTERKLNFHSLPTLSKVAIPGSLCSSV